MSKISTVILGDVATLKVSGCLSLTDLEINSVKALLSRYKGKSWVNPRVRLSAQLNLELDKYLLNVVSSDREMSEGVYRIKILGPYTYLKAKHQITPGLCP